MSFEMTEELKKKVKAVEELKSMKIVFGVVDEDKQVDGIFVHVYAVYNEFGTNVIPARPFFRSFFWNKEKILNNMCKNLFAAVIGGEIKKPVTAYKRLGRYIRNGLYDSLMNGNWKANAYKTINKKKSDRPLFDTGALVNCLGFVIYKDDVEIYREVGGYAE
ncbi:MAG: hypothetical protein ACRCZ2_02725 [Fusobacteriaceae bacterium]